MKKSLIAGAGVAALAMAAVPFVGAFATAEVSNSLTDHIKVTVPASCSITNTNVDPDDPVSNLNNYYAKEINNGEFKEITGTDADPTHSPAADSTIGVSCNVQTGADAGWRLTAVGAGETGHETQLWDGGSNSIASLTTKTADASLGDATSNWSFKVVIDNTDNESPKGASPAQGFTSGSYFAVPASEMDIATGTGDVAEGTFTMSYGVYVSGAQASGTYNGAVKYTLYNPAS